MEPQKILVAGVWESSPNLVEIRSPFDGHLVGTTYLATPEQVERAAAGSVTGFEAMRALGAWERGAILRTTAAKITERREELAALLSAEAGKPIRDARAEIDRGALTFRLAAEEAERMIGETIPLDLAPASKGRLGITRRFPVGPVLGISPFNFPLNLAAHKVAPAIAAGCSIVLKPPSADPLIMLKVAEVMTEAGLPEGALSVIPTARDVADKLIDDERFRLLSFTGSPVIGWKMKARAGKRRVLLELGGNAACIAHQLCQARLDVQVHVFQVQLPVKLTLGNFITYLRHATLNVSPVLCTDDFLGRQHFGMGQAALNVRLPESFVEEDARGVALHKVAHGLRK